MLLLSLIIALAPITFWLYRLIVGRWVMVGRDIREEDGLILRLLSVGKSLTAPLANGSDLLESVFAFGHGGPRQEGDKIVFEAAIGWRLGYLAVAAYAAYQMLVVHLSGAMPFWDWYVMNAAILIYGGAYIFSYRFTVDGVEITNMTLFFVTRRYQLTQMTGARRTRKGFTLYFADKRRANIPLFIEGRDVLIAFLGAELDENGL